MNKQRYNYKYYGMIFCIITETIYNTKFHFMNKALMGVLLGAAAYGLYRYSKMTPEQKSNLRRKGKDFLDKNLSGLDHVMGKKRNSRVNVETAHPY